MYWAYFHDCLEEYSKTRLDDVLIDWASKSLLFHKRVRVDLLFESVKFRVNFIVGIPLHVSTFDKAVSANQC